MAELIALNMCTSTNTPKFTFKDQTKLAKCLDVHDGDTARFAMCPFPGVSPRSFSLRMYGYNSAEIHSKNPEEKKSAEAARNALAELICGKIVTLKLRDADKYGRLLGDVYVDSPNGQIHVNAWMIDNHYGKKYFGQGEKNWE